jgi:putative transposase
VSRTLYSTQQPRSRTCLTIRLQITIESLNYQFRKVTKARGHFPTDDAVVKLLWLAIINIEDKRAREREVRRQQTGKRSDQPAKLVEGQRVQCWREALNELDAEGAHAGRPRRS